MTDQSPPPDSGAQQPTDPQRAEKLAGQLTEMAGNAIDLAEHLTKEAAKELLERSKTLVSALEKRVKGK